MSRDDVNQFAGSSSTSGTAESLDNSLYNPRTHVSHNISGPDWSPSSPIPITWRAWNMVSQCRCSARGEDDRLRCGSISSGRARPVSASTMRLHRRTMIPPRDVANCPE